MGIESLSLSGLASFSTASDIGSLTGYIFGHVYQAAFLLTHVDVDLRSVFQKELSQLAPLFSQFDQYSKRKAKEIGQHTLGYELRPLQEESFEPGIIYGQFDGHRLVYKVKSKEGDIANGEIHLTQLGEEASNFTTLDDLKAELPSILAITTERGHTTLLENKPEQDAHQLGLYCGIAVNQLKPQTGKVDYTFLTQFSAQLPNYLGQWTEKVQ